MNYIKQFYSGFKELIHPKEPIKRKYIAQNNYLIKNAILRPLFKDYFYIVRSNKYKNLFQTNPCMYTSLYNTSTCIQLEKDELYYEKLPIDYI